MFHRHFPLPKNRRVYIVRTFRTASSAAMAASSVATVRADAQAPRLSRRDASALVGVRFAAVVAIVASRKEILVEYVRHNDQ